MTARLKGITVVLHKKTLSGTNDFGEAVYTETTENVANVLVSPASAQEILDTTALYGRKAVYTLGIPKGDTHIWENVKVEFFGETWQTFGIPLTGIDALIPLDWNTKVTVERYNG